MKKARSGAFNLGSFLHVGGNGFELLLHLVEVIQDVAEAEDHPLVMLLDQTVAGLMFACLSHVLSDLFGRQFWLMAFSRLGSTVWKRSIMHDYLYYREVD